MKKVLAFVLCVIFTFGVFGVCANAETATEKVYALTMGVHKYSANNTVSDGSGVTYTTCAVGTASADLCDKTALVK